MSEKKTTNRDDVPPRRPEIEEKQSEPGASGDGSAAKAGDEQKPGEQTTRIGRT